MKRWLMLGGVMLLCASSCGDDEAPLHPAGGGSGGRAIGAAGDSAGREDASGMAGTAGSLASGDAEQGGASVDMAVGGSAAGELAVGEGGSAPSDPGHDSCLFPEARRIPGVALLPGFCAWVWATGVGDARGLKTDASGNVLAISRTNGTVVALWDDDHDGISGPTERSSIAVATSLNHGLALQAGYLYASSATEVYRWKYAADRKLLGAPETVINGMPATGHSTRTLVADTRFLYVASGSETNLDSTSLRARVLRFPLAKLSATPTPFSEGELFADGLRNTVGLGFDARGTLWGVDNGQDDLTRADLGGDIHEDNPADELNAFAKPGASYGYPYCWAEYELPLAVAAGRGSQWVNPGFVADGVHSDTWCRTVAIRPVVALPAHSAALDVLFYRGKSFPSAFVGGAFIAQHGSHDRTIPSGYSVSYVRFSDAGQAQGEPTPVLSGVQPGYIGYRPVGLAELPNGVLLISNDTGDSSVLALGYRPPG